MLILTSGSHAPIAIAAAEAGKHMLVEKPMCFSVAEGRAMIEAAAARGVTLMVGYNKRYDPAYRRSREEIRGISDLRLVRVTTLESPLQPYVAHYRLHRATSLAPELAAAFAGRQPGPHHRGYRRGRSAGAPRLPPRAAGQHGA